jgi:hypothetical protein
LRYTGRVVFGSKLVTEEPRDDDSGLDTRDIRAIRPAVSRDIVLRIPAWNGSWILADAALFFTAFLQWNLGRLRLRGGRVRRRNAISGSATLTHGAEWSRTLVVPTSGRDALVGSRRSLLRQSALVVFVVCASGAFAASAAAGPAPDPAPPGANQSKPVAQPKNPPPPPPAATTQTTQTPTVSTRQRAVQPVAPQGPPPPGSPAPQPQPVQPSSPPPAPVLRRAPVRTQTRKAAKNRSRAGATKREAKRVVSSSARVAKASSSPDSMLLAGGLALVALIVGELIFLSLSVRLLRPS